MLSDAGVNWVDVGSLTLTDLVSMRKCTDVDIRHKVVDIMMDW